MPQKHKKITLDSRLQPLVKGYFSELLISNIFLTSLFLIPKPFSFTRHARFSLKSVLYYKSRKVRSTFWRRVIGFCAVDFLMGFGISPVHWAHPFCIFIIACFFQLFNSQHCIKLKPQNYAKHRNSQTSIDTPF